MKNKATRTKLHQAGQRHFNGWRLTALILIGLILGTGAWLATSVLTPVQQPASTAQPQTTDPAMTVSLTKRQANEIVTYYLNDLQKGSPVKYSLTLADQAVLGGTFKFFGQPVKFQLLFDPLVLPNGNVELKARQLNVGSLPVPVSAVMSYAHGNFKLPTWVRMDSKKKTVVLDLNKFKMASGMKIKATKIDLPNSEINFSVFLPKK
ncbi:YpmS family protein [Lacticaseibacillus jixianensis]|uniref:YpmS family protein n=1 Tax=Lacticaseibacillus jixianensis TaxID=2486012 RepID=A0ABW4B9D5_9LACO|nr:YpmS family protein [Lacticaseibacillus jixianensis]